MERTDHAPQQHPPGLPEPSYARQVLTRIADILEQPGNRGRLLQEVGLRRAFNEAVAVTLHELPTPVADETALRVADLLPDCSANTTHGTYAQQLRHAAEAV